jgi:hypothetical protein
VIGTFCGAIANLSPLTYEFRRNMDDLNSYIRIHDVQRDLGRRLREYFHQARHLVEGQSHLRLLSMMSPALQVPSLPHLISPPLLSSPLLSPPLLSSRLLSSPLLSSPLLSSPPIPSGVAE